MNGDMTSNNFFEKYFIIHGEMNGVVHKTKRNGVSVKYPYDPVSPYRRTALTIRNEWIRKFAMTVSNPQDAGYQGIIKRLNYYTPYILSQGIQKFLAETVFFVRQSGEYEFNWQDSDMSSVQKVYKRTILRFGFRADGDKVLDVFKDGELHCRRWFIITAEDLDEQYENWLSVHLEDILVMPEPEFSSLKTYRRGMTSRRNWIISVSGKEKDEIFYEIPNISDKGPLGSRMISPWIYHRKSYDHFDNAQTVCFFETIPQINAAWQAMSDAGRQYWNNKANRLVNRRVSGYNLFTGDYLRTHRDF